MKFSTARFAVTAGLAASLALAGCSFSASSETTTSVSDGETTTTTTTTTSTEEGTKTTTETTTTGDQNLADLKRAYAWALKALHGLVVAARPEWGAERVDGFVYALMPFTLGIYTYAHHTPKQLEAMAAAGLPKPHNTTYDLVYDLVLQLL